jgi:hypothetical protein
MRNRKKAWIRPDIKSRVTNAQVDAAVAAMAAGERQPEVCRRLGLSVQQFHNIKTGRTIMLADGPNRRAVSSTRRAA